MSWGLVYNKSWLCHKHWSWLYAQGKHSENIQSTLKVKVKVAQSCPTLWPHGLYSLWNSPGQNTGMGSCPLLQGIFPTQRIFPTQGSNPGLRHCGQILYQLSHQGSPRILEWGAYIFYSRFSWPRNQTGVSCIAGGFFTHSTVSLGQAVLGPSKWSQCYCISHWRFSIMLLIPL